MTNETITMFTEQPYIIDTFNIIVSNVVNSVVELNTLNDELPDHQKFTDEDTELLDRKVEKLTDVSALTNLKNILANKLSNMDEAVIQKYMEVITYLDSPEYKSIIEIENAAFEELASDINATASLKPITL